MNELFDTHFHWDGKTPPGQIAQDARDRGVRYLVCIGGDLESSRESAAFTECTDDCWFTSGVHPHYACNFNGDTSSFEELIHHGKHVAVGEIGLDYFYEHSDKTSQMKVMCTFAELAMKHKLPMVVHCRDRENCYDAYSEVYEMLKDFTSGGGTFVIHCFTGNMEWLEKFLGIGAYVGITGMVTFPKAQNIREAALAIPPDKLLMETDSPYLAPVPHRGKINLPMYLPIVADKVASVRNISLEQLARLTTANALRFYRLA